MSVLLKQLIEAFQVLPGVGPKSAQRMVFHLLERDREAAKRLAASIDAAIDKIGHCRRCRNYTETRLCSICDDNRRDASLLCVVETPADQLAIEQATDYRGQYFILMGRLSPLDGIGPEELGLGQLGERLADEAVREVVIATNPTVEGEATAHYVSGMAKQRNVSVTRLAQGIPSGGELEYLDRTTLAQAFGARQQYSSD